MSVKKNALRIGSGRTETRMADTPDGQCYECGDHDCELFWVPQKGGWWCEACKDAHDEKWGIEDNRTADQETEDE